MVQAFEEDPWSGLLSKQEICDMIKVDQMVGLGMRDHPEAMFDSHSVTSKRVILNGVVYQVIVLKEKYVQETEITKVVEIPSKEKVQEIVQEKEVVNSKEDTSPLEKDLELVEEIVEVIEIEDDEQDVNVKEPLKSEKDKVKEEKEEDDVRFEEEISSFKEKPWSNLRKKIVDTQIRKTQIQYRMSARPINCALNSPRVQV